MSCCISSTSRRVNRRTRRGYTVFRGPARGRQEKDKRTKEDKRRTRRGHRVGQRGQRTTAKTRTQSSGAWPASVASSLFYKTTPTVDFFTKQCGHTRGSYGSSHVVKHRCLIGGVARGCAANSLLFAVHSCPISAQARKLCLAAAGACRDCSLVVAPCAFLDMVVTFHGRRKGNLVVWRSKVNFS